MKRSFIILLVLLLAMTSLGCAAIFEQIKNAAGGQAEEEPYAEPIVEGAPLVHHFEFNNNLNDSLPTGTALEIHSSTEASSFSDGAWHWQASQHPGGGLILLTDQISDPENYAIGFRIRFNEVGPSWKKILSFRGESIDGGLYFYDGQLQLYPFNANADISYRSDTYYDFILSRTSNKLMTVFVVQSDGSITKVYEEQDLQDESVPVLVDGLYQFIFFTDDTSTSGEWTTGGSIRSLRVWNGSVDHIRFD